MAGLNAAPCGPAAQATCCERLHEDRHQGVRALARTVAAGLNAVAR